MTNSNSNKGNMSNSNSNKGNMSNSNSNKGNMSNLNSHKGKIIICPTPIGNLDDISYGVKNALSTCDVVYCEDTRVTSKLLNYLELNKKTVRLDENTMDKCVSKIIDDATSGKIICYCSDAGMPGVSDPGLKIVSAARCSDVCLQVLPGPCAAINAYVESGFNCASFYFGGFFPRKETQKIQAIKNISCLDAVAIFYESPKRIVNTLECLSNWIPDTKICVCRELTKLHQEVIVCTTLEMLNDFSQRESIKGEIVFCIEPIKSSDNDISKIKDFAQSLIEAGVKPSKASKLLTEVFDINKNEAYDICLEIKS